MNSCIYWRLHVISSPQAKQASSTGNTWPPAQAPPGNCGFKLLYCQKEPARKTNSSLNHQLKQNVPERYVQSVGSVKPGDQKRGGNIFAELRVHTGAFKLQADEELDSKPLIMHSGGKPAVRAGFVPLHEMTVLAARLCICWRWSQDSQTQTHCFTRTQAGGQARQQAEPVTGLWKRGHVGNMRGFVRINHHWKIQC